MQVQQEVCVDVRPVHRCQRGKWERRGKVLSPHGLLLVLSSRSSPDRGV